MKKAPRILIADDEQLLLSNLITAARGAGYEADGASDGLAALDLLIKTPYDLLVTDIRMPGIDGLELIKRLRGISPRTRFLAITAYASLDYAISCLRHGASDFLVKPFDQEDFLESVGHVLEGVEQGDKRDALESGEPYGLSEREKEVLGWARTGKSSWEIGQILEISESTVKFHFNNIFRKLSVSNKTQAVARAIEEDLF